MVRFGVLCVGGIAALSFNGCGESEEPPAPPVDDTLWEWCPEVEDAVFDDDWGHTLTVGPEALYCGSFHENRILEQELGLKAQLRFIPGQYQFPVASENSAIHIPFCVTFLKMDGLRSSGEGTVTSTVAEFDDGNRFTVEMTHPVTADNGDEYELKAYFSNTEDTSASDSEFTLDGTPSSLFKGPVFDLTLCTKGTGECSIRRQFLSCTAESYLQQEHEIIFEGGEVRFTLQMGASLAGTEPAAFVRAEGMLDGEGFQQADYFKLIYNPEHHHFSRDFAVLFDSPIQGACGLKVTRLDPWAQQPTSVVSTTDCSLTDLDSRSVESESFKAEDL